MRLIPINPSPSLPRKWKWNRQALTYGLIGDQRLVIKAKNLSNIVEVWMLNNKGPQCVVQPVVEVGYGDLHTPVVLIVDLQMPVHPNRAHVVRALQQRYVIFSWSVYSHHTQKFGIAPASPSMGLGAYKKTGIYANAGGGYGSLLDTVIFVLAATSTRRARSDCFIVERREGDTATWIFPGSELWISASHIPCHCIHYKGRHEGKMLARSWKLFSQRWFRILKPTRKERALWF